MSGTVVQEDVAAFRAAFDVLADRDIGAMTGDELVAAMDELQTLFCQLPAQWNRMLARLQAQTTPQAMGAKSWRDVLAIRWRLSTGEAGRRLAEAEVLGPRQSLTGERLDPVLPAVAAAQSGGLITADQVTVLRDTMGRLPGWVDAPTRAQIEVDLVRVAVGVGPKELADQAKRRLFLLDQDGPEPDDTERARKRGICLGKQGRDGTSPVSGWLTPEARATWEPIFAKFAAPGMCNPDDDEPCVLGTPIQAQIDNDHRSPAQRRHDAFVVIGRIALMGGELGQLNGLPVSIIIRTTLQDLESRAGVGVSGGGTIVPIADVIRLAAHANHFLAVFDKATGSAMDLFRARRVASPAQRIMLIGRDGGCTKPSCTVPAYGAQVHHAAADWADDGNTNVDEMGLACGPDNRMVGKSGGWTTRMNERHDVEWIPPPHLDTGQTRINHYHRPETLICPTDQDPKRDNNSGGSAPPESVRDGDGEPAEPFDPWAPDAPAESDGPAQADDTVETAPSEPDSAPEPFDPWAGTAGVAESASSTPGRDDSPASEPFDRWRPATPAPPDDDSVVPPSAEPDQDQPRELGPLDPWGPETPDEPGGPAPPDGQAV
jgi:hypothetical protein